jgi:hypothetical protein
MPYKLILPSTSTSEYFLLENRWPSGWDLGLRGMPNFSSSWLGGLLVLHIDNNAGTAINDYTHNVGNRQGVVPIQASTATCDMLASGTSVSCRGNSKTLFYAANNSNWTPASSPNSNYYSGSATDFYLTAVSAPGGTMTAEFSYGSPGVPGSPNMGLATRGNRQASVSFAAPSNDGGSAISSYTAISSPGEFTASAASSPIIVTGLANGTAYTFTVKATNINGIGPISTASNIVIPATFPGAPSINNVIIGSGQTEVDFNVSASDGGSVIYGYTVVSIPADGVDTNAGSTGLSHIITSLINGVSYTFTVSATNSVGSSLPSSPPVGGRPGLVRDSGFNSVGYQTLQVASDADTHTSEFQIVTGASVGSFLKTNLDIVNITGGYDAAFTAGSPQSGAPSILGKLTLQGGTTRVRNIKIR